MSIPAKVQNKLIYYLTGLKKKSYYYNFALPLLYAYEWSKIQKVILFTLKYKSFPLQKCWPNSGF